VFTCAYKHARTTSIAELDSFVQEQSALIPLPGGNSGVIITEGQLLPDYPVIPELPLVRVIDVVEGLVLPTEPAASSSLDVSVVVGAFQHLFVYNDMGVITNLPDLQVGMVYSLCGMAYTCLLCTWPLAQLLTNFNEPLVDLFQVYNYVATSNGCLLRYVEVNPYSLDPRLFGEGQTYISYKLFYDSSRIYATHLMAKNGLYNPLTLAINEFYYEQCITQSYSYLPPRTAGYREFLLSETGLTVEGLVSKYKESNNEVLAEAYANLEANGCLAEAMFGALQQDIAIG
jgi:hypothetical protein